MKYKGKTLILDTPESVEGYVEFSEIAFNCRFNFQWHVWRKWLCCVLFPSHISMYQVMASWFILAQTCVDLDSHTLK